MENYVEMPLEEGKAILAQTAMSLGYEKPLGSVFAESVCWLEDRSLPGVSQAISYMVLSQELNYRDRKRQQLGNGGIRIHSPVWSAMLFCELMDDLELDHRIAIQGPISPLLMAPMIVFKAADFQKAVRMRFLGEEITLSDSGIWVSHNGKHNSSDLQRILMLDPTAHYPTSIELVEINTLDETKLVYKYKKSETLRFPEFRIRDEDILYLGV